MPQISKMSLLIASVCFSPVFAQAPGSSDAETIKQLERDWTDAQKTGNTNKLAQILADDWVGLDYDGAKMTKKELLDALKSGTMKMSSVDVGPMDVKILGSVAIVQGSDTETSSSKGKDTSGKWVWMDVFVKQGGKWRAVRSQSAMVK